MNKKGQVFQTMGGIGVSIVSLALVLVIAFLVVGNTKAQIVTAQSITNTSEGTLAYNSTMQLESAAATIPGWIPLIVLVGIGSVILALVSLFGR